MNRITIKDVARLSGVSISSVSRYLADPASINPAAALAVNRAINELNYIPNPFAQNLKSETTKNIAIILPDISDHFFSEACKAICNLFYMYNYSVTICDTGSDPEKERRYIDEMVKYRSAGIMLVPCGKNTEFIKDVLHRFPRLMLLDRLERDIQTDMVSEDNERSGYILARYMLDKGQRRFMILSGSEYSVNMRYRLSGIQKALKEKDIEIEDDFSITNLMNMRDAGLAFENLLQKNNCPRCILAGNTHLLEGVVITASRMKLSVPEEYTLGGFSVEDPRYIFPFPVAAIIQRPAELGTQAGEMLLKRLRSGNAQSKPRTLLLNTDLVSG